MEPQASAQTWSLTKEQRKGYLNYYAPVILKRGDENNNKQGRDWITNFDFDQDGDFSNNRVNWLNIPQYVNSSAAGPSYYDRWRIRPTLYTSLIEYMEGSSKSIVLLYHVYNATDKDGKDIHDWERVEILVHGVAGTPGGGGEYVNHVTVTMHGENLIRRYYDAGGLNFMQTATGKHILIWQADESDWDKVSDPYGYHAHALWHVKTPYSTIASRMSSSAEAEVNLYFASDNNVHYVFVPEGSQSAVSAWGAKPLSYATASSLASRVDNGHEVPWNQVKRITYELQDWADIVPTHWESNPWYVHWLSSEWRDVLLESPVLNEAGQAEVNAGMQRFYLRSRDIGRPNYVGADEAFLYKNPFYGTYSAELNSEAPYNGDDFGGFEGLGYDSYGRTRGAASGYYNSHYTYWWQHDFFVHSGVITSDQTHYEAGVWLPGAWYTAASGGFDGRWVQLFDDRPGYEPIAPLALSISGNSYPQAYTYETWYAAAANGTGPYSYSWYRDGTFVGTGNTYGNYVDTAFQLQVTVTDATGATATSGLGVSPNFGGTCGTHQPGFPLEDCGPIQ
ncbi:MAG TPA: hypothetical protein VN851_11900 [Thermoanaerobaculia bacterium]|nr:hypothetical protein [Thermoanaerobaculia bacterium]